jgi:hypothetical protein
MPAGTFHEVLVHFQKLEGKVLAAVPRETPVGGRAVVWTEKALSPYFLLDCESGANKRE